MPKRSDITSILIIGAGPIVIGQACEFDYSGTQAVKTLKAEGYRVILVNSNPATIMTDPELADATYIEPITPEFVEKIIAKERPDALLPTMGGQTALNCAKALAESGVLAKYDVELIGARLESINKAENRQLFGEAMARIGLEVPKNGVAHTLEEAWEILERVGLPAVIRPSFTLGGSGGGIAYNREEFEAIVTSGLDASPTTEVLIDESVLGWKEYEMEVVRDKADNCIIVCSIENIDPMGVHTGDSITVAPALTLTDKEYQILRDASIAVLREIGVDTGGSNVQFAVNPENGRMVVIEMNPRVSRSSALASKATGFPIAKVAAKLAVGYTLDEVANDVVARRGESSKDSAVVPPPSRGRLGGGASNVSDASPPPSLTLPREGGGDAKPIPLASGEGKGEAAPTTRHASPATAFMPASFEPTIDYIVTKIPRFTFEKFPGAEATLSTSMKSVGEAMAMGRSFAESLQKALRSLETGLTGLDPITIDGASAGHLEPVRIALAAAAPDRLLKIAQALRYGMGVEEIHRITKYDPWFIRELKKIVEAEAWVKEHGLPKDAPSLRALKQLGFSDRQLAALVQKKEKDVRKLRHSLEVRPVFKRIDTCAAEFESPTPYLYSTYEYVAGDASRFTQCEAAPTTRKKIVILGGGPNRIGQGIEFDYCCVHACYALKEGVTSDTWPVTREESRTTHHAPHTTAYETIMINCNPETVSTDYDTADRLYFEPLTAEDVIEIIEKERENGELIGVIVQFGGQTPLKLAHALEEAGIPIIGTSVDSIDLAEDRERFQKLLHKLKLKQPKNAICKHVDEVVPAAESIGFPVVVRPSYVLGGRAMRIIHSSAELKSYVEELLHLFGDGPILLDRYLSDAIELDVDCLSDGEDFYVPGIMEHIEEAGIHSGDSACSLPPYSLPPDIIYEVRRQTIALAKALKVVGLMNVQFAVKQKEVSKKMGSGEGVPPPLRGRLGGGASNVSESSPPPSLTLPREGGGNMEESAGHESQSPSMEIYILEVNPRASRTVPFVAKATGIPIAKIAARIMAGEKLSAFDLPDDAGLMESLNHVAVKEVVFPFARFPGVDTILGPEMKSTGETMGIDRDFARAFAKGFIGSGSTLPASGTVFLSVKDGDKQAAQHVASQLVALGFELLCTRGTGDYLKQHGLPVTIANKVREGRPHVVDFMKDGKIAMVFNTTEGIESIADSSSIRRTALMGKIPYSTTIAGARAMVMAIAALKDAGSAGLGVTPLQDYVGTSAARKAA